MKLNELLTESTEYRLDISNIDDVIKSSMIDDLFTTVQNTPRLGLFGIVDNILTIRAVGHNYDQFETAVKNIMNKYNISEMYL